jgi:nucleoside-diphosphate-sugar epimerase
VSPDPYEQDVVEKLGRGEAALREFSARTGVPHTILRPTLIYDGKLDQNITAVASMIRRLGFFLVAGRAAGLRQPIHADDVARFMIASIDNKSAFNRSFNITGCAPITYREMVSRVATGLGKRPLVISLPGWLLKGALYAARWCNLTKMSPVLFDRMNQDLAFDDLGAKATLGVTPRDFIPIF